MASENHMWERHINKYRHIDSDIVSWTYAGLARSEAVVYRDGPELVGLNDRAVPPRQLVLVPFINGACEFIEGDGDGRAARNLLKIRSTGASRVTACTHFCHI